MATGIVSIGIRPVLPGVSVVLLVVALVCYAALAAAHLVRLARFRSAARADLADPGRGFGFFTFVAGSAVLGTRLLPTGHEAVAAALLIVAGLAWVALGYLVPWKAAVNHDGASRLAGINGTWFVWVVASQSVAVLSATLQPRVPALQDELALVAVLAWSAGLFLYGAVSVLVVIRLMLHPFRPSDMTPTYWVAMGATAISVLAGSHLLHLSGTPLFASTRYLVLGMTVVFWAFGTWLIPALLAGGWWRHVTHCVPLRYEPALWSMVFPLGMYGVATRSLGTTEDLPLVRRVGEVGVWIALAVWGLVFIAMLTHVARTLSGPRAGRGRS